MIKGEIFEGGSDIGNSTDDEDAALMQSLVEDESFVMVIYSVKGDADLFSVTHLEAGKITVCGADASVIAELRKYLGLTRKVSEAWYESSDVLRLVAPLVIYRVRSLKK